MDQANKIYKMNVKVNGVWGEMGVIAESQVGALFECLHLLDLIGVKAQDIQVDTF